MQAVYFGLRAHLLATREAAHKAVTERNKLQQQQQQQAAAAAASQVKAESESSGAVNGPGHAQASPRPSTSGEKSPDLQMSPRTVIETPSEHHNSDVSVSATPFLCNSQWSLRLMWGTLCPLSWVFCSAHLMNDKHCSSSARKPPCALAECTQQKKSNLR